MTKWWNGLHSFQQVLFVIACASTLFMIVQIILLAVGSGDNDATFDGDTSIDDVDTINDGGVGLTIFGLRILTVRSIIAFLAVGSWLTFALFYPIEFWAILPGVAAGIAAAFCIALFMKAMDKLQGNGNLDVENTVGKTAEVYLTVPAARGGAGKVNVYVQERYAEMDAVTDCDRALKTGERVTITGTMGEGTVVVAPFAVQDNTQERKEETV